jgi:hypothetical protein
VTAVTDDNTLRAQECGCGCPHIKTDDCGAAGAQLAELGEFGGVLLIGRGEDGEASGAPSVGGATSAACVLPTWANKNGRAHTYCSGDMPSRTRLLLCAEPADSIDLAGGTTSDRSVQVFSGRNLYGSSLGRVDGGCGSPDFPKLRFLQHDPTSLECSTQVSVHRTDANLGHPSNAQRAGVKPGLPREFDHLQSYIHTIFCIHKGD